MICIIPVRAGSTEIPRKNLRTINGETLLHKAAAESIDTQWPVVVLADSDDLAAEAATVHGVKIWRDKSPISNFEDISVRLNAFKEETQLPDSEIVILRQCTSHKISPKTFQRFMHRARAVKSGEALLCVSPLNKKPTALYHIDASGALQALNPQSPATTYPRQPLPGVWWFCGALCAFRADSIDPRKWSIFDGLKLIPFFIDENESSDIDREEDFFDCKS